MDNFATAWLRHAVVGVIGLFALVMVSPPSQARTGYPARAITIIVPFAAGGPTDTVTRIVAVQMADLLGQRIIVENVVGSGGTTAAIRTKRAAPDGYTMIMGHIGTHGAVVAAYPDLAYDPVTDFKPVGMVVGIPIVVVTKRELPVGSLAEFVDQLRDRRAPLRWAHAGAGSLSFAACSRLNAIAGVQPAAMAFQGTGPAIAAVAEGRVDYLCDQISNAAPRIRAGQIKAIAIASPARSPVLPEVPTAAESGVPQFEIRAWIGLFAPRDTDPEIIARINGALSQALDDPSMYPKLLNLGAEIPASTDRAPSVLGKLVEEEVARWRSLPRPEATESR